MAFVPRDTSYGPQEPEAGVGVYAFPVSAGISPQHHFVIGASQQATRRPVKPLPFLGAHEEEALGLAGQELDLAEARLWLYCLGAEGVRFSYARRSPGRSHLPPGLFVGARRCATRPPAGPRTLRRRGRRLGRPGRAARAGPAGPAGRLPAGAGHLPGAQGLRRHGRGAGRAHPARWSARPPAPRLRPPAPVAHRHGDLLWLPVPLPAGEGAGPRGGGAQPRRGGAAEFGSLMHEVLQGLGRRVMQEEPGARLDPPGAGSIPPGCARSPAKCSPAGPAEARRPWSRPGALRSTRSPGWRRSSSTRTWSRCPAAASCTWSCPEPGAARARRPTARQSRPRVCRRRGLPAGRLQEEQGPFEG